MSSSDDREPFRKVLPEQTFNRTVQQAERLQESLVDGPVWESDGTGEEVPEPVTPGELRPSEGDDRELFVEEHRRFGIFNGDIVDLAAPGGTYVDSVRTLRASGSQPHKPQSS
jgi:hypothetical protein